jgi:hypothetical protein
MTILQIVKRLEHIPAEYPGGVKYNNRKIQAAKPLKSCAQSRLALVGHKRDCTRMFIAPDQDELTA